MYILKICKKNCKALDPVFMISKKILALFEKILAAPSNPRHK